MEQGVRILHVDDDPDLLDLAQVCLERADERFGLRCYIGKKLVVEKELFGTLCFVDDEGRDEPFTPAEKTFFDLLTRWFDQLLGRKRRRRLSETVFETVHDAVFVLDVSLDGTLSFRTVNRAYRDLTGRSTDELRGRPVVDVFGDDEAAARLLAQCRNCIEDRERVEFESEGHGGAGPRVRTRIAPVVQDGDVVQLVGAMRGVEDGG